MRIFYLLVMLPLLWSSAALSAGEPPLGWTLEGPEAAQNYDVGTEAVSGAKGARSAFLRARSVAPTPADLMQVFAAQDYAGKRVRLAGSLRSQGARGAYLFITTSRDGDMLDIQKTLPIRETSDWKNYDVVVDVPREATVIKIGFAVQGKGTVWVDDLSFSPVSRDVPATADWVFTAQPLSGYKSGSEQVEGAPGESTYLQSTSTGRGGQIQTARMTAWRPAASLQGKRVRFTTRLKLDAVDRAGCALAVVGSKGTAQYQMSPSLSGTTGWIDCSLVMQMPDDATRLIFRYSLMNEGKVWSDGLRAVEVGSDVPLTHSRRLPDLLPCDIAEQFKADGVAPARCDLGFRF